MTLLRIDRNAEEINLEDPLLLKTRTRTMERIRTTFPTVDSINEKLLVEIKLLSRRRRTTRIDTARTSTTLRTRRSGRRKLCSCPPTTIRVFGESSAKYVLPSSSATLETDE